ncbi:hypothetical protein FSP39_001304 [Pinctada imbricata]|uniref:Uncharacterized protein n=1 Tax=Pinctada imbricata TaxID=66713 RepID=A0AA89BK04_PINIB|nr:hypothetical protein FSP39_001304 [Pinctada imbricata]
MSVENTKVSDKTQISDENTVQSVEVSETSSVVDPNVELAESSVVDPNVGLAESSVIDPDGLPGAETSLDPIHTARSRKMTDRGRLWKLEGLTNDFNLKSKRWRRSACHIEILLSDSTDPIKIRENRESLVSMFSNLEVTFGRIVHLCVEDDGIHADCKTTFDEFDGRFEAIQVEHHAILKDIKKSLIELEGESRSVSGKSRGSHTSRSSSHSSRNTKVDAAALRAKLKYVDIEARHKADLDKVQIMKELDIAEAKLEAMGDMDDHASITQFDIAAIPKDDSVERTRNFIASQTSKPEDTNPSPILTSGIVPILTEPVSHHLSTGNGMSHLQQPVVTSVSLNPTVSEFIPGRKMTLQQAGINVVPLTATQTTPSRLGPLPTIQVGQDGNETNQGLIELAKSLADQVHLGRLPAPEPSVFMGDPLKYPGWKVSFETLIEQRKIPVSERIHYLKKYLGGKVKDVVENYFLLSTGNAFDEAKKLLDERYGHPFIIANAFRDKLENWSRVNARDGLALQRFADFLRQCYSAMQSIGSLNVLNDERENRKMLSKLPDWIVTRWGRIVVKWKDDKGEFPPFKEFVDFLSKEAKIATDPITSLQSVKSGQGQSVDDKTSDKRPKRGQWRSYGRDGSQSLLTGADDGQISNVLVASKKDDKRKESCILCEGNHQLDYCKQFLERDLKDRKEYIRTNGLCFGCLRSGHLSKKCRSRKRCGICSKFHPTSLHGDIKEAHAAKTKTEIKGTVEGTSGATHVSQSGTSKKSSMILPVYVSHINNPDNERLVYALLDSQSDTTFILKRTAESLYLSEVPVTLKLSTMHAENLLIESSKINGLMVRGYDSQLKLNLPVTYTRDIMPCNRSHIPTPESAKQWPHLEQIAGALLPLQDCEVGLLIGYNCTRALTPRDVIVPDGEGPFGQRTDLGWGVVGVTDETFEDVNDDIGISHHILVQNIHKDLRENEGNDRVMFSVRNKLKEVFNPTDIIRMMEADFNEGGSTNKSLSHDDRKFLSIIEKGIHKSEGHYEMPLPFRDEMPRVRNNEEMALGRLQHLKKRFLRDRHYHQQYIDFMNDLLNKGFAEEVPSEETNRQDGREWYIPHHGVYHPQKPGKLRVVFDCSAKYMGQSLNDLLLQGPDQINLLSGVLCRFRKEPVAFICDIEKMFLQFKVNPEQRNYLRFLWWENGDVEKRVKTYRMTVHLFGAKSSPGCANYALKKAASDLESKYGSDVTDFIQRDFYVDDGLKSLPTAEECISLIERSVALCKESGLFLHKFVSNSKEVLTTIPQEIRAKEIANINIHCDKLPVERTLGIQWCVESDSFQFRIILSDRPFTRRGVLSTLSSVYDPLGFVAPFILLGKQILQEMCKNQIDWDSPLPEGLRPKWSRWIEQVKELGSLTIRRCLRPDYSDEIVTAEIHHFSDASTVGYGQCSYLRLIDVNQRVYCSLLMAKSRVTPIKPVTIPRLELTAALVSVRVSSLLLEELDIPNITEWYWTDSSVVLGYINNDSRRFHVFVANRVSQIRDHTEPYQWSYVSSENNPADIASRGATPNELRNKTLWFKGPEFLWESNLPFSPQDSTKPELLQEDPEVKVSHVVSIKEQPVERTQFIRRLDNFSNWNRTKRVLSLCLKFIDKLRHSASSKSNDIKGDSFAVENLQRAEMMIIRLVQEEAFSEEIEALSKPVDSGVKTKNRIKRTSAIIRLDPFLDKNNVLRVGGRIGKTEMEDDLKHPIILPRKSHVTELLISHCHDKTHHQGRNMTTNEIRQSGFWIIGCSSAVYSFVSNCVTCRKRRSEPQVQKMSELPFDRLQPEPPFTYSGVDFFGPFIVKEGRKEMKRWGVIFTCMASRAVHLETANSLDTSSFINALRRFMSVRGTVRQLRSDRGTNFIGAKRELREAVEEMDDDHLKHYLSDLGCDFLVFKTNVPSASHMGGIWERQIRTVRSALSSIMQDFGSQLDDETLRTFFSEAMAIVNSRPLSIATLNDPLSVEPLTPNHLLTMKSKVILPPPGKFMRNDLYCRRRWRRVQYLSDQFWCRWKREYLQTLQERQKWLTPKRNLCIGDIVLVKDDNAPRNVWQLGRVIETTGGSDGFVRKVKIVIGDKKLDRHGKRTGSLSTLERPIHKLVLVLEADTGESPDEEP